MFIDNGFNLMIILRISMHIINWKCFFLSLFNNWILSDVFTLSNADWNQVRGCPLGLKRLLRISDSLSIFSSESHTCLNLWSWLKGRPFFRGSRWLLLAENNVFLSVGFWNTVVETMLLILDINTSKKWMDDKSFSNENVIESSLEFKNTNSCSSSSLPFQMRKQSSVYLST